MSPHPAKLFLSLSLLLAGLAATPALAQQAWLMTYGTGDRVEERFGHNAIWIRDAARGIDRIYNFGFFDFDKPGFYREYLFGRMVYFAIPRDPAEELAYYRWRDRDVRAQRLDLDAATIRRLGDWLEERVAPENRDFRYDYYFNNCSNRIRDALDFALDGQLRAATENEPASMDFRAHTRRLVEDSLPLYLGIHAGLGRPADRPRSEWEEMFLPDIVAREAGELRVRRSDGTTGPLVAEERWLYRSTRPRPPASPSAPVGAILLLALGSLGLVLGPVAAFRRRPGLAATGLRAWILVSCAGGLLLLFLWGATEHRAAWRNENLLLLNPLLALLWRCRGGALERMAAGIVAAGLALAVLLKFLPGAQWNWDLLAWLLPTQAAALFVWRTLVFRSRARNETGPASAGPAGA